MADIMESKEQYYEAKKIYKILREISFEIKDEIEEKLCQAKTNKIIQKQK
jgi:hypothetical protein